MAMDESELDALLAGYSKPASVTVEPELTVQPTASPTPTAALVTPVQTVTTPPPPSDNSAPWGRYESGKKKGLPRPQPKYLQNQPTVTAPVTPTAQPQITGAIIDGGLFLTIINLIFPMLIALGNNYFSDTKIDPKKIQLKDDQIKDLKQVTTDALKQVNLTGNPILILFIGLASAFAVNFMAIKMETEIKQTKKP